MTKQQVSDLVPSGQAVPVAMSRAQKLEMLAKMFELKENATYRFNALYVQIEYTPLAKLIGISTDGTALEPVVNALNARGISTENTVGSVMKNAELSQGDLHELVCHCRSPVVEGRTLAKRLRIIADPDYQALRTD